MRSFWNAQPRAASGLRLLVLAVVDRCDQRCVHCQIWKQASPGGESLTLGQRLAVVDDALAAGVAEALLTGGEPLVSPDLWPVAQRLRAGQVRLLLATNGMLLGAYAERVGRLFDEVYVSLDGASAATHDGLRGAPAFDRVAEGVAALARAAPSVLRVARSTLHARNLHEFLDIIETTRRAGFDHVSFLPLDASSAAFGGAPEERSALVPDPAQVDAFEAAIARAERQGAWRDGFVLETAEKLRRLARHLRASGGSAAFERPDCDAPLWSVVVEADGAVRPCFFHDAVGDARYGVVSVRSSGTYQAALARIRAANATCARCVCPKKRGAAR